MIIAVWMIGLLIVEDFILFLLSRFAYKNHYQPMDEGELPRISVLIPARNEETTLPACLASLENLDYPADKIEFVIGDDQSSDNTGGIVYQWTKVARNRVGLNIQPPCSPHQINGKANALAQLASVATGDYYLFSDADCVVNPLWAREMIGSFSKENGMIIGITAVGVTNLFSAMQAIDWWITLGMIKISADVGHLPTGMGNNMLVSRDAYLASGGFERLAFSLTEDYALAQALIGKGYRPLHQATADSLIKTKAIGSFSDLLMQRKRWMHGAMSLPWYWLGLLLLQVLFFPAIIYLSFHHVMAGLILWVGKIFLQSLFIRSIAARSNEKVPLPHLIWFEFYYLIVSWSTIVYYFWPTAVYWKERKY